MKKLEENSPKTSEDAIFVFEKMTEIGLPRFYRNCLMKKMDGLKEGHFKSKNKEPLSSVRNFFYLNSLEYDNDLILRKKVLSDEISEDFLPVADDNFGNIILLCLKGPHRGKVYFWDHEVAPDGGWEEGVTLIADSFEEFVNSIEPDSEE